MKEISKMFENTMAAVAFAEAGETETARQLMNERDGLPGTIAKLREKVYLTVDDLTSIAITFAEAGEHEKATEILREVEERLEKIKWNHQKDSGKTVLSSETNSV